MFCALAFSSFASAQAVGGSRIAVIDSQAFRETATGITKYVTAVKTVENEFAPSVKELDALAVRLATLEKEVRSLRQSGTASDQATALRKADEYERLKRDQTFKREDVKARYERRFKAVIDPLNKVIGNALNDYGKQKGFALIFDLSRDTDGLIAAIPDEKTDITKEFIAFFNAKP